MSMNCTITGKSNSFFDSKEFFEFMCNRIEIALMENEEYKELVKLSNEIYKANDIASFADIENDVAIKTQYLSYLQGWKDAVKLLTGSLAS